MRSLDKKYAPWIGRRFGFLTVLTEPVRGKYARCVTCRCDCGNTTSVYIQHLTAGHVKSCGCYRKKVCSDTKSKAGKLELNYAAENKLQRMYYYFLEKRDNFPEFPEFCKAIRTIFMEL